MRKALVVAFNGALVNVFVFSIVFLKLVVWGILHDCLIECWFCRQPLEGQLFKYTNVMKGWQYRWFVLNPDLGKLEYFEVKL